MSIWIFNKREAKDREKAPKGRLPAASAPRVKKIVPQSEPVFRLDITVDETILAIDSELTGLAQFDVAQAAKERGWATLRRELEHRPVRAAAPSLQKGIAPRVPIHSTTSRPVLAGHSRGWRLALGSAVAAVAVMAVLLGTYGAGLLGTSDSGTTPDSVAVGSTDVTQPDTTVSTGDITPSTDGSNTTDSTDNTDTTVNAGTTGDTTDSTPSTTHTTGGPTPTSAPTTTQPKQTTTTNEQQYAAAQRAASAKDAALDLADAVVLYHMNDGDISGIGRMVAPSAKADLTQMISSLIEPYGSYWVSTQSLGNSTFRVTIAFNDRVPDERGGLEETIKTFRVKVVVDNNGATITAINAGS